GEVLTEHAIGQVQVGIFRAPEGVVLDGVDVDGLVGATMHREVGLLVAVEVEVAQHDTAGDGLLEEGGRDNAAAGGKGARATDLNRDDAHAGIACRSGTRAQVDARDGTPDTIVTRTCGNVTVSSGPFLTASSSVGAVRE